jgi:hypothetical protein
MSSFICGIVVVVAVVVLARIPKPKSDNIFWAVCGPVDYFSRSSFGNLLGNPDRPG